METVSVVQTLALTVTPSVPTSAHLASPMLSFSLMGHVLVPVATQWTETATATNSTATTPATPAQTTLLLDA